MLPPPLSLSTPPLLLPLPPLAISAATTAAITQRHAAFCRHRCHHSRFRRRFCRILQREFRLFKNTDPEEKHQKAIPISVISELIHRYGTDLEQATGKLATIGIFFAMRSCEYLKVTKPDQRRTEILRLRNIRFFQGVEQVGHDHKELESANCIALTFERQKKDKKIYTVTLMVSQDARLCPVRASAAIVRRIRKYPGSSQDSPISTVKVNGHLKQVTSTHMIHALRYAVGAIGEVKLRIKKEDIGTHSIRSGAAMAMYLGECSVFMIMLIGCWSSNAFLRYIRKQVMEFSQNVAKSILSCQNFRHIPDIHMRVKQDNPRIRNHPVTTPR